MGNQRGFPVVVLEDFDCLVTRGDNDGDGVVVAVPSSSSSVQHVPWMVRVGLYLAEAAIVLQVAWGIGRFCLGEPLLQILVTPNNICVNVTLVLMLVASFCFLVLCVLYELFLRRVAIFLDFVALVKGLSA